MIKLIRVDYRLLHGQVVFSWVQTLGAQRVILVDDEAASDELKITTLKLAKPPTIRLNIFSLETALKKMPKVEELNENIIMIFGKVATLRAFCEQWDKVSEVNYGAITAKEGSKRYADAVYLTAEEAADTQVLLDKGIRIFTQQTPATASENLTKLS